MWTIKSCLHFQIQVCHLSHIFFYAWAQIVAPLQASDVWDPASLKRFITAFRSHLLTILDDKPVPQAFSYPATIPAMEPRRSGYGQLTPTTHHDTYPYIDPSQYNMTGRVIFISGATKGIGRAAALSFAKAGVSGIVIAGRSVDLLHTLEAEIIMTCKHYKRPAVKVLRAMIDICDSLTIESAMAKTREVFGHIDILVNSAATVDQPVPISASNSGDWSFTLDTNVTGTYHLIKAALLLMNQDSNAPPQMIINLVSAIINMPTSRSSAYTVS